MNILVVLRNLYNNPDPFDEESLICDSDINVLTEACDIKDSQGGKLTALLVSESKSDYEKILKKAASYGADDVIHAPCDGFDFSDANAFSRLLAKLISSVEPLPDVVMFGRLAYDGDSVNISTQVAENLCWNRALYSGEVEEITPTLLRFHKSLDDGGTATCEVKLPVVIHSVRKRGLRGQARIADILRAYNETVLQFIDKSIVDTAMTFALNGPLLPTPTQEIPPYLGKTDMKILNGTSDVDTASNIIETLRTLGFEPKNISKA